MSNLPIGAQVVISEGESGISEAVREVFASFSREVLDNLPDEPLASAADLRKAERVLGRIGQQIADHVAALLVLLAHLPKELRKRAADKARAEKPYPMRSRGREDVTVRFAGGSSFMFRTPYLVRQRRGQPGRPRKSGGRGPSGTGVYPMLALLGICWRVTPTLALDIAWTASLMPFADATASLAEQGIELDESTVIDITYHVASKSLEHRKKLIEAMQAGNLKHGTHFAGRRVAVSIDGGRLRTREGRKGRRKKATNRRGFKAPWREPVVIAVYELDENGRKVGKPYYEATMGQWEDAFEILAALCISLGVRDAEEIVFVADGAKQIWNSVEEFKTRLGYDGTFTEVLDYYHAAQKVYEVADLRKSWSKTKRGHWARQALGDLNDGRVDDLVSRIRQVHCGRYNGDRNTAVKYFERNADRLRYQDFREASLPRGSGPVESAIRRVVNLRLKNVGIFWIPENAERMLQLRCYLKANRWSELFEVVYGRCSLELDRDTMTTEVRQAA